MRRRRYVNRLGLRDPPGFRGRFKHFELCVVQFGRTLEHAHRVCLTHREGAPFEVPR
jgi:hypothetical protein